MSKGKPIHVRLRGQNWKIIGRKRKGAWGVCDYGSRTIAIHPSLLWGKRTMTQHCKDRVPTQLKRLECLLHESIHACYPDLCEESVAAGARELTSMLIQMGYGPCAD